ncbi:MAG: hypothetical protein WC709_01905 [Thermoleophilia bacterium]
MRAAVELPGGLSLAIADWQRGEGGGEAGDGSGAAPRYPTAQLQKGLLLFAGGQELAEEGVGFGVPILKRGPQTVFPGRLRLSDPRLGDAWEVTAAFEMNLVERLATRGGGSVEPRALYAAKDWLAALHRRAPGLRRPLAAASAALRRRLGWVTTYAEVAPVATLEVTYTVHAEDGLVSVTVAMPGAPAPGVTEVVVMNELGARHFRRYEDSAGAALQDEEIGTWDEVSAARASFASAAHRVAFSLGPVAGSRLYRGRDLVGSRLAWAGFGYSYPPALTRFTYDVKVERHA